MKQEIQTREKKSLESKLKAVKKLKSSRLIGTAQAFRYLKIRTLTKKEPRRLANEINAYLRGLEKPLDYLATPQRVLGLIDTTNELISAIENSPSHQEKVSDYNLAEIEEETPSIHEKNKTYELLWDFIYENADREHLHDSALRVLTDIFETVQGKEMDDDKFGAYASQKLVEICPSTSDEKSELDTDISATDWTQQLSSESFKKIQKLFKSEIRNTILFGELTERLEKMKDEGLAQKTERKREILMDYLMQNGISSYEGLRNILRMSLKSISLTMKREKIENPEIEEKRNLYHFLLEASASKSEEEFISRYLSKNLTK